MLSGLKKTSKSFVSKKTSVTLLDASSCKDSAAGYTHSTASTVSSSSSSTCSSSSSQPFSDSDDAMISPMEFLENLFARHGVRLSGRKSSSNVRRRQTMRRPCPTEVDAYDMDTTMAVRKGNLDQLKELHRRGCSLDASNRHGESLLHISCRRGSVALVKFMLLEAKVNPRVMDDMGRTAFHDALWSPTPNFDTVDVLLQVLPPVSLLIQDVRGHTPFEYAPRKHWGFWLGFLQEREGLFVQWINRRKQFAAMTKMSRLQQQQENQQRQQQENHSCSSSTSSPTLIPSGAYSE